jgi:ATP-dependent helicase/DNAse subunit B
MRLSYSSIDTYQSCPLKYKYRQIDRIPEPKSKEALFGTLIHGVMKFIHTPAILSPTFEQAIDHFSRGWREDVFESPLEERAAFTQGVDMIRRYYEMNEIASAVIVDLESRFQIDIGNEELGQHVIAGSIDRIDKTPDGYEIIDYKTTKKMPPQSKVDEDLQLTVYLKAFLERYPAERERIGNITVSLYFLKHGVKLSAKRTMEDLARLDERVFEVIEHIQNEEFEPILSPLCDWRGLPGE